MKTPKPRQSPKGFAFCMFLLCVVTMLIYTFLGDLQAASRVPTNTMWLLLGAFFWDNRP